MTMRDLRTVFSLAFCAAFLVGCETAGELGTTIGFGGKTQGTQGEVAMVDPSARGHLTAGLTTADYMAFAEKVTNSMLISKFVQGWGTKRPRLILGVVVNNTDNENIRVKDIYDRIQETILGSGLVRIVDPTATAFEYIIKPELSSTRQYGKGGKELAFFTLQLKMFKLDGELVGQWSDDLALGRT